MKKTFLLLLLSCLFASQTLAQDYIRLQNGTVVTGRITENNSVVRIIDENSDTMEFPKSQVVDIRIGETPILPTIPKNSYTAYAEQTSGWWFAISAGCGIAHHSDSSSVAPSLNMVTGYRLSEYLRLGVGITPRLYLQDMGDIAKSTVRIPIHLDARGNFFSDGHRMFAPFWNAGVGYSVNEGGMALVGFGTRFGQPRSAFVMLLEYRYQHINGANGPMHIATLQLGYEF